MYTHTHIHTNRLTNTALPVRVVSKRQCALAGIRKIIIIIILSQK